MLESFSQKNTGQINERTVETTLNPSQVLKQLGTAIAVSNADTITERVLHSTSITSTEQAVPTDTQELGEEKA